MNENSAENSGEVSEMKENAAESFLKNFLQKIVVNLAKFNLLNLPLFCAEYSEEFHFARFTTIFCRNFCKIFVLLI